MAVTKGGGLETRTRKRKIPLDAMICSEQNTQHWFRN
jgi:hypothetical protein